MFRSDPGVSQGSLILGEFNEPARLYIQEGPVRVDGYDWYLVAGGWVAAAGKDGEEWLRPVPRDEGSWILVASQRLPVYASVERAVAGPDGRIYVFGGLESNYPLASPVAAAWSFDLEACTWEELAPMPIPVQHPGVALSADGLIYAVGGWTGHEASSGVVAYDPAIDTWVNKAMAPEPVAYGSAVAATPDSRIWLFHYRGAAVYEPATDSWAPTPGAMAIMELNGAQTLFAEDAQVTTDGDIDLVLGGAGGIARFDPETSTARMLGVPPITGGGLETMPDGRILVTGGPPGSPGCYIAEEPVVQVGLGPTASPLMAFAPESGEWTILPPLSIKVASGVMVDGRLYVLGFDGDNVVVARYEPPHADRSVADLEPAPGVGCF